jgi:multiple sugar transport system substrate-binding protein
MKKRILSVLLCAAMVGTMLVGCGSSDDSSSADTGTAGDSAAQTGDASEFDWKAYDGTTLNVQFNEHTYANAVVDKLDEFEELTGIKVEYTITPESNYFDKLNTSLSSRSGTPDIFMSGAYQLWQYIPAGYVEPLDSYINNASLTAADYNYDDFYDAVVGALKWSGVSGDPTGSGSQWALPMGYELNALAYNKNALSDEQVEKIKTTDGLLEVCKELDGWNGTGSYGIAVRGSRNWGTIHAGYMTLYGTWGAKDCEINDEKGLTWLLDSDEAVAMTDYWVQLCKTSTSQWSTYTWSEASSDLGAGQAAMLFDATSAAYFQNFEGASDQSGNIAWMGVPVPNEGDTQLSNVWVWSMAMNADSQNKEAAWYFLQYFTSPDYTEWAATEGSCIDCARESIATSDAYGEYVGDDKCLGYTAMFDNLITNAKILFTPQPYFEETTTEWAATLQDLVTSDKYSSTEEAMKALNESVTKITSDVVCE